MLPYFSNLLSVFVIETVADLVVLGQLHLLVVDSTDIVDIATEVEDKAMDIMGLDQCRMQVDMAMAMDTVHFK